VQQHAAATGTDPAVSAPSAATQARERLIALLDRVAAIADRARPFVRRMTLLTALSATWLAWYVQHLSGAPLKLSLAIWLVLLIPAATLGWMWWLLSELRALPARLDRLLGSVQSYAERRNQVQIAVPESRSAGLGSLFSLGGELRRSLASVMDANDIHGTMASALVLANPLVLMVLVASLVWAFGMMGLAVLTAFLAVIL
jgi:hypothetical protein